MYAEPFYLYVTIRKSYGNNFQILSCINGINYKMSLKIGDVTEGCIQTYVTGKCTACMSSLFKMAVLTRFPRDTHPCLVCQEKAVFTFGSSVTAAVVLSRVYFFPQRLTKFTFYSISQLQVLETTVLRFHSEHWFLQMVNKYQPTKYPPSHCYILSCSWGYKLQDPCPAPSSYCGHTFILGDGNLQLITIRTFRRLDYLPLTSIKEPTA